MLEFFAKLQNEEYRLAIYAKDSYDATHPLSSSASRRSSRSFKSDPAWNKPIDPALEARFQRVKAKLLGYVDPEAGGRANIPRATRAFRRIMRAPMPITSAAIPTRRRPRRTRCSRPTRTIPISSS